MTTTPQIPALEDEANQCFLDLVTADNAHIVGEVVVDTGHIEVGDCGDPQVSVQTNYGDGVYHVWRGDKYLIIEMDLFNVRRLELELADFDDTHPLPNP